MRVDDFDFELPNTVIAKRPASPRNSARLLEVTKDALIDRQVRAIPDLIRPGDVVVFNDTRVIPARLLGRRGEVPIEILLHRHLQQGRWQTFAKPGKRLKAGQTIIFDEGLAAGVIAKTEDGLVELEFNRQGAAFDDVVARIGHVPLPPYISRNDDAQDRSDYQTVYAARNGAVAAPTAGLHFTPELLAAIDAAGARRVHVTLHVGAGTFLPVKVNDTADHRMHSEYGEIDKDTAATIAAAHTYGGRVIAVGTTSARLLEAATRHDGAIAPFATDTALFITPGYRFKMVDVLMTNFHLPKSTLFMLGSAFAGLERMKAAYAHAIASGYRFYSYGDASWLHRA